MRRAEGTIGGVWLLVKFRSSHSGRLIAPSNANGAAHADPAHVAETMLRQLSELV